VRKASVEAGGLVAVARNPVTAAYAKANGTPGAISRAIAVGEAMLAHRGEAAIAAVTAELGGKVIATGEVTECRLETSGGFDAGVVHITDSGRVYEMTFWNEYMSLELDGERLATFPDLIMTLDIDTGRPVITAAVAKGQQLAVIAVPKERLLLSTTMSNSKLLQAIEPIIHKPILPYL
ncbi:S-methyl thiohydantoin desulfurase domain-containing protein, partial [Paenibacillus sp. Aloe-11]|uniref:S-methyl thiohydantoin desulfurase domain-containing protein n=1 Tax=Paenibacillus sp. Aloe-11 TaxID=1050222 RepID=UPI00024EF716